MQLRLRYLLVLAVAGIFLLGCKTESGAGEHEGTNTVLLRVESKGDPSADALNAATVADRVERRLNELHVKNPTVKIVNSKKVLIQLPSSENPDSLLRVISMPGFLEFKSVNEGETGRVVSNDVDQVLAMRNWNRDTGKLATERIVVKRQPILSGDRLRDVAVYSMSSPGRSDEYYVFLQFSVEASEVFERFTSENIGKKLAIVVDGIVFSAPVIRERMRDGRVAIMSGLTSDEARNLAAVLKTGPLPVPVEVIRYESPDKEP